MKDRETFAIEFADIVIAFRLPGKAYLSKEISAFLIEESKNADAEYYIELLNAPLAYKGELVAEGWEMKVYKKEKSWVREFLPLIESDGCQVACETRKEGHNTLYYPAIRWNVYSQELRCLHLIGIEETLLKFQALLLHSSMVEINGQMVLFSGASGIGKSTQASLWEKYLDADIINGDRCVVRKKKDKFYGCGSPWCGTSAIYRKEQAPIKGIFILKQAPNNSVRKMRADAFIKIFQQTVVNSWNSEFMNGITELIVEMVKMIPIYELSCRPDEEAVYLAYKTLFEEDI